MIISATNKRNCESGLHDSYDSYDSYDSDIDYNIHTLTIQFFQIGSNPSPSQSNEIYETG